MIPGSSSSVTLWYQVYLLESCICTCLKRKDVFKVCHTYVESPALSVVPRTTGLADLSTLPKRATETLLHLCSRQLAFHESCVLPFSPKGANKLCEITQSKDEL